MISHQKTFVEHELPDEAALRRAGIQLDLPSARLVATLWSRVMAHGDDKRRERPATAARALGRIATAQVKIGPDEQLQQLVGGSVTNGCPAGATALAALGIESADIASAWAATPTFPTSCLPVRWILAFLPAEWWPVVAGVVECHPDRDFLPRVHEALREHGLGVGLETLLASIGATWVVLKHLFDINREVAAENEARARRGHPTIEAPASLFGWSHIPKAPSLNEVERLARGGQRRDTSAVPLDSIQHALKARARAAHWGAWHPDEWPFQRHWKALKEFLIICLLVTGCPRIDHLRLLDVDDFDVEHAFEDGSRGPGLRFRKTDMKNGRQSKDEYWKRLPDFVADVLVAWIACSGRKLGQSGAPLLIAARTMTPGEPGRRYAWSQLGKGIAGAEQRRPLLPLPGEEWKGYTPNRFRSAMLQIVERLVASWRIAHPADPLASYSPHDVAELAIDHRVKDLGYRDYRERMRLEQLLALAIDLTWAEVWGDGLETRQLDARAIRDAHGAVGLMEAQIASVADRILSLETQERETLRPLKEATEAEQLQALLIAQAATTEIRQLLRREVQLRQELSHLQQLLHDALTTPVVLDYTVDADSHQRELAQVLALVQGATEAVERPPDDGPMADELTVSDLAELFDVSDVHVRRWRDGFYNPPFDPQHGRYVTKKDWRYPVAALDQKTLSCVPADEPERLLEKIRRERAVQGFGRRAGRAK
jgi:hypothetical protein